MAASSTSSIASVKVPVQVFEHHVLNPLLSRRRLSLERLSVTSVETPNHRGGSPVGSVGVGGLVSLSGGPSVGCAVALKYDS